MEILEVNDLRKVYTTRFGGQSVEALRSVTFAVEQGGPLYIRQEGRRYPLWCQLFRP